MRTANLVKEAELRSREDSLKAIRELNAQISDLKARLSVSDQEREGQVEAAKLEERKRAFELQERARKFEEQVAEQARDLAAAREELAWKRAFQGYLLPKITRRRLHSTSTSDRSSTCVAAISCLVTVITR